MTLDPLVLPVGTAVGALVGAVAVGALGTLVGAVGALMGVSHLMPVQPWLQVHSSEFVQLPFTQMSGLQRTNGVAPAPVSRRNKMY